MNKEQLLLRAKELGINDAENLKTDDLKLAVKAAEIRLALIKEAKGLNITILPEMSSEDIQNLILATQISDATQLNEFLKSRLDVLAKVLCIDNHQDLSISDLEAAASEKIAALTEVIEAEEVEEKPEEGKTDKVFKAANGNSYQFKESAPAKFRFMSVVKTQEQWIKDKEAMEQLVFGNVTYVELIKK